MEQIYLSRRNLLTLLSKLDRKKQGELTLCTIIKERVVTDPFVNSIDSVLITAVEDCEFYNCEPGQVHPKDVN